MARKTEISARLIALAASVAPSSSTTARSLVIVGLSSGSPLRHAVLAICTYTIEQNNVTVKLFLCAPVRVESGRVNFVTTPQPVANALNSEDRNYLRCIVEKEGLNATAIKLAISRGVISSAVAGIPIRRGSIELLREALGKYRGAVK